jgi:hypothetical protein
MYGLMSSVEARCSKCDCYIHSLVKETYVDAQGSVRHKVCKQKIKRKPYCPKKKKRNSN